MVAANTSLNVSSLSFFDIKNNLKDFLKSKPEFTDYNFDGSTMSMLLDVLAYNTYYNSVYTNFVANELFLDSSTLAPSVYSISKMLNYTPRSARSAVAQITITFSPTDSPSEIVIPAYTKFTATVNGVNYTFTTDVDYSVFNVNGVYSKTIDVYEGIVLSYQWTKSLTDSGYYEIPVAGVDTGSLSVSVRANSITTTKTPYTLVKDITEVSSTSPVFYLQKNANGFYEIYFGDGILGKALDDGNIINATFRACNGSGVNDVNQFSIVGYSGYNKTTPTTRYTATITSVVNRADGGDEEENIDSIKFNAPRSYEIQNRLITAGDYKQFIMNNYPDIQSVSVWGGENNNPPIYGKSIIAIKPNIGYVLTNTRKTQIINDLEQWIPMSIDTLIIDPIFLFVTCSVQVNYNSSISTLNAEALYTKISTVIEDYEETNLNNFGNRFKLSRFMNAIDMADIAIESSEIDLRIEKRFFPTINSKYTYQLAYQNAFKHPYDGYLGCITSTAFTLSGSDKQMFFDDDGLGKLRIYYFAGSKKIYYSADAGTVDYVNGIVTMKSLIFSGIIGDELRIMAQPQHNDIYAVNNQIILLSFPTINLFDVRQNRVIFSDTVEVLGNQSLVRSDGILNTVVL